MAHINHKIIFTGPVGAGKTTAIASISDIEMVSTDEAASDMTKKRKAKTTVAMDYGVIFLSEKEKVHLYGTPGQERFDFMWDILVKGGLGLIVLVDNTRATPFHDLKFYIDAFRDFIGGNKLVVGVTQMDVKRTPSIDEYRSQLQKMAIHAPVFEVDARRRDDVSVLIQSLLLSLDPGIQE
jgi:signal recognition particle receptor subunit beta